jgi:hypothetical protein
MPSDVAPGARTFFSCTRAAERASTRTRATREDAARKDWEDGACEQLPALLEVLVIHSLAGSPGMIGMRAMTRNALQEN